VEAAIPSPDLDLEATAAVQAAVIAELRAANATLAAVNAEQARLIATLQAQVGELERRLGKDSSNSSKPPSSDGLRKSPRAARRADEQTARRRPGKQPGAPGAHLAQVAEPDQVLWHVPERCGGCGAELADAPVIGVEARQVFDLPLLRLRVAEHRAQRRRCACGTTTAAGFPDHVRAAACYGPGVRALVCYLCVHQHLPVDRAAQLLADVLGASVATGTLAAVVAEGARGLDGFVESARRAPPAVPGSPLATSSSGGLNSYEPLRDTDAAINLGVAYGRSKSDTARARTLEQMRQEIRFPRRLPRWDRPRTGV
jgi:transposase